MHSSSRFKHPLSLILLILLLTVGGLSLAAQKAEDPADSEQTPASQQQYNENTPTMPSVPDADNDPAAAPEVKKADSDVFDYQPSEKISEDLSVSFPVDI